MPNFKIFDGVYMEHHKYKNSTYFLLLDPHAALSEKTVGIQKGNIKVLQFLKVKHVMYI